jgi:serine/threonine-protein kinase RsbT
VRNEVGIPVASVADIVVARQKGRALASELGFSATDSTFIATAISELARNIVAYAKRGEIALGVLENSSKGPRGLQVVARDEGPGIANVSRALQGGYSSSGSLGLGLPGVRRLMDEFEIVSQVGKGTTVSVKKWLR